MPQEWSVVPSLTIYEHNRDNMIPGSKNCQKNQYKLFVNGKAYAFNTSSQKFLEQVLDISRDPERSDVSLSPLCHALRESQSQRRNEGFQLESKRRFSTTARVVNVLFSHSGIVLPNRIRFLGGKV